MLEAFDDCVKPLGSVSGRIRRFARDRVLDVRSLAKPLPRERFLRFIYAHYVFDDQHQEFEALITALSGLGEFVTTERAVSMVRREQPIDGRYFHLSFDDGLDCIARNAVPVLRKLQVPAIVFVNSAVADSPSRTERAAWDKATNYGKPLKVMDWSTLAASGLEVGSHSRTHHRLSAISRDPELLISEISGSKTEIEKKLGRPCKYFAWPFGRMTDVDEVSLRAIREAGFDAAFGGFRMKVDPDRMNPYMIPRHHFEPQWPLRHVLFFARGGMERPCSLPDW